MNIRDFILGVQWGPGNMEGLMGTWKRDPKIFIVAYRKMK